MTRRRKRIASIAVVLVGSFVAWQGYTILDYNYAGGLSVKHGGVVARDLARIAAYIEWYHRDHGRYPVNDDELLRHFNLDSTFFDTIVPTTTGRYVLDYDALVGVQVGDVVCVAPKINLRQLHPLWPFRGKHEEMFHRGSAWRIEHAGNNAFRLGLHREHDRGV